MPGDVFATLGRTLGDETTPETAHLAICTAASALVRGCDHASMLHLGADGTLATTAATDDVAETIDRLERELRSGPCIDALGDATPQVATGLSPRGSAWPALADKVLAVTPVKEMLGFRIATPDRSTVLALNLFADRVGRFGDDAVDQGLALAQFCSMALAAATHREQARQLREALRSNRQIGQAVGLLMAHRRIDDKAAFAVLRKASMDLNLKLAAVAEKVITGHLDQLPGRDSARPGHTAR